MTTQQTFLDRTNDRRYFTILPNLLWIPGLGLTAHDIILYATIKRVAGENGVCFMSTANLACEARMSTGQVSKSKRHLAKAKLIEITTRRRSPNGHPIDHITIVDVWQRNVEAFQDRSPGEPTPLNRSPDNRDRSPSERYRSPGETEEDPLNKIPEEPEKQEQEQDITPAFSDVRSFLVSIGIQEPNLSIIAPLTTMEHARAWWLYVQAEQMPSWRGYLVNRLKRQDPPPPDFLEIAKLTPDQLDALASTRRTRHWAGSWHMAQGALAEAGIEEEIAELWYQLIGKEERNE